MIEVVNMQFSQIDIEEPTIVENLMHNLIVIFNNSFGYFVILLIALFVVKPLLNRVFDMLKESEQLASSSSNISESEQVSANELDEKIDDDIIIDSEGNASIDMGNLSTLDKLNNLVEERPEDVLGVIRSWIYGGDKHAK